MSRRTSPPFRADHVGSLLRPAAAARRRGRISRPGGSRPSSCGRSRTQAIADAVRMQEEVGLQSATDGEFRRASWHMDFIYQIGGVSKAPGNLAVKFHNPSGDIEYTPAALHVGQQDPAWTRRSSRTDFTYLKSLRHHGRAQADHPVAEHGPLPRRPRRDRPGGLPGHRGVLERPVRRLRRRGRPARRAGLHLPPVRRHQPGLPERPGAAGRDRRARRGRRAPAPALHQAGQRRAGQDKPAGHGRDHAHVPGQLPVLLGRARAATTSWPRPCSASWTWTASSWSTTTSGPAASSRCGSCRQGKMVVLGLVTTKRGELENPDELKRRIDEAAKFVPLDQLCLSGAVRLLLHRRGQRADLRRSRSPSSALIVEIAQRRLEAARLLGLAAQSIATARGKTGTDWFVVADREVRARPLTSYRQLEQRNRRTATA